MLLSPKFLFKVLEIEMAVEGGGYAALVYKKAYSNFFAYPSGGGNPVLDFNPLSYVYKP